MNLLITKKKYNFIIKKNLLWSFVIKLLSVILSFYIVPFVLKLVNTEKYGLWVVLFSIVSWIGIMDLGLGNGFRNKFTEAYSNKDTKSGKELVQTLYSSIGSILIFIFIIYSLIHPFLNWNKILNISNKFDENINSIVYIVLILFLIQFYTSSISTILLAIQKSAINSSLVLLSNFLSIIFIFVLNLIDKISLNNIAIATLSSSILINLIFSFYFFNYLLKEYKPKLFFIPNKDAFNRIFNVGVKYFIIQIAMIIMFSSDNYLITYLFGPSEVTLYNTSYRIYSSAFSIFMIILTPFWSSFTNAIVEFNYTWIKKCLRNLIYFWLFFSFAIFILNNHINFFLKIWISELFKINKDLGLQFTIYIILLAWINIFTSYINASSKINLQLKIAVFQMFFNIPLAIILAKNFNFGVPGILMATNINLLISAILLPIQTKKLLNNNAKGFWNY
jgi:O-antigen/teichoic acid export membrane protein